MNAGLKHGKNGSVGCAAGRLYGTIESLHYRRGTELSNSYGCERWFHAFLSMSSV